MKKITLMILLSLMVMSMVGCQSKAEKETERIEMVRQKEAEKVETEKRLIEAIYNEKKDTLEMDKEEVTKLIKAEYPNFIQIIGVGSGIRSNTDNFGKWSIVFETAISSTLYSNINEVNGEVIVDIESIEFDEDENITNINYEWSITDLDRTNRKSFDWNMPKSWVSKEKNVDNDGYIVSGVKMTSFDPETSTLKFEFALGYLDNIDKPTGNPLKGFGTFEVPRYNTTRSEYSTNSDYDDREFSVWIGTLKLEKPSIGSWTEYNEYNGSIVFYETPEGDIRLNIMDEFLLAPLDSELVSFDMKY